MAHPARPGTAPPRRPPSLARRLGGRWDLARSLRGGPRLPRLGAPASPTVRALSVPRPPAPRGAHLHAVHAVHATPALLALRGTETAGQTEPDRGPRENTSPRHTHLIAFGSPGALQRQERGEGSPETGLILPPGVASLPAPLGQGWQVPPAPASVLDPSPRGAAPAPGDAPQVCAHSPSPRGPLFLPTGSKREWALVRPPAQAALSTPGTPGAAGWGRGDAPSFPGSRQVPGPRAGPGAQRGFVRHPGRVAHPPPGLPLPGPAVKAPALLRGLLVTRVPQELSGAWGHRPWLGSRSWDFAGQAPARP